MVAFEKAVESISIILIYIGLFIVLFATAIAFILRGVKDIIEFFNLRRHSTNPIISPTPGSGWDEIGTFNPAAIIDESGDVHLIYRSIGNDGVSKFGYAFSKDGKDFKDKSPYPVYAMQNPRNIGGYVFGDEYKKPSPKKVVQEKFDPVMYPSGGSWGGSEDPRMVNIEDKVYVTFSAFDGWDFMRMALISIDKKDFLDRKWKWSKPLLISPAGEIHKNWVLFPEKIGGKFAIMHSISPKIEIEFIDSMEKFIRSGNTIKSWVGPRDSIAPREGWDSWIRGVGPPPLKTSKGWLVLYHATTRGEGRYKLGAMLLDLDNPQKVIARSPLPILAPDEWYENEWKAGVVYACGAVIKDGVLLVYYGGGDKHVCIAERPLNELLDWLLEHGKV